ncbi:MAG TPA: trehalose-6-phosphate synthase [Acidimicrobiales bacterium]
MTATVHPTTTRTAPRAVAGWRARTIGHNHLRDLVIVANRLPVTASDDGDKPFAPSPGGLVGAVWPALSAHKGTWVGWPGGLSASEVPPHLDGVPLVPVELNPDEHEAYYEGFSNATIWPLYHDAIRPPVFEGSWWPAYRKVNERFAHAAAQIADLQAIVWVHDYHLQLVPSMLRELRPDVRIAFFLHIPFPPPELFRRLPWRRQILEGMLGADLIGFQTQADMSNFVQVARLAGATGRAPVLGFRGRSVRVGVFPATIDHQTIQNVAADPAVVARSREIREELGSPDKIVLGVDRLDYTKGIDLRLDAIGHMFHNGTLRVPEHVFVQIAVPSRGNVDAYADLRDTVERQVGAINGDVAVMGQPAVHYLHRSLPLDELVALYLAADVMLVTPLRDGMNLVAKEYVAARLDYTGALVLSEFAGAAHELRAAHLVNPHDLSSLESAITAAVRGDRERARMKRLRKVVLSRDVRTWASELLASLP